MRSITVNINPNLYGKDPSGSELGLKILKEGLRLMDEIGFESFAANEIMGIRHKKSLKLKRKY